MTRAAAAAAAAVVLSGVASRDARAQPTTWTNTAGDRLWVTPGNWSAGVPDAAGEDAIFAGAGAGNVDVNNAGNGFSFNAATFTAGGYRMFDSAGANDALTAAAGFSFNAGTNEAGGGVLGNSNVTLGGAGAVLRLTANVTSETGLWVGYYDFNGGIADTTLAGGYEVRASRPFHGVALLGRTPDQILASNAPISFASGATAPVNGGDEFLFAWTGAFTPTAGGDYTFRVASAADGGIDDSGSIYVDANRNGVFEPGEGVATSESGNTGPLTLDAGESYNIAITFNEDGGGETFSARFRLGAGAFTVIDSSNAQFSRFVSPDAVVASTGNVTVTQDGAIDVPQEGVIRTFGSLNVDAGRTFTKTGAGRLAFTTASTTDGNVVVSGGVLEARVNGALGTTAGTTVVNDGGQLFLGASYTTAEPLTLNGPGPSQLGALAAATTGTFAGPITLGSDALVLSQVAGQTLTLTGGVTNAGHELVLGGLGNVTVSGQPITGTGGLRKVEAGTATISVVSGFNGPTTVDAGTLNLTAGGALTNSAIGVANGATLQLSAANTLTTNVAVATPVTLEPGSRLLVSNSTAVNRNVTVPGGAVLDIGTAGLTGSGAITFESGVPKTVRLSNAGALPASTGQVHAGMLVPGDVVQINASNPNNLGGNATLGVVFEIFGGNRAVANFDLTGRTLSTDGASREFDPSTGAITVNDAGGAVDGLLFAPAGTTLYIQDDLQAGGNTVQVGSLTPVNGRAGNGTVRFFAGSAGGYTGNYDVVAGTFHWETIADPAALSLGTVTVRSGAALFANDEANVTNRLAAGLAATRIVVEEGGRFTIQYDGVVDGVNIDQPITVSGNADLSPEDSQLRADVDATGSVFRFRDVTLTDGTIFGADEDGQPIEVSLNLAGPTATYTDAGNADQIDFLNVTGGNGRLLHVGIESAAATGDSVATLLGTIAADTRLQVNASGRLILKPGVSAVDPAATIVLSSLLAAGAATDETLQLGRDAADADGVVTIAGTLVVAANRGGLVDFTPDTTGANPVSLRVAQLEVQSGAVLDTVSQSANSIVAGFTVTQVLRGDGTVRDIGMTIAGGAAVAPGSSAGKLTVLNGAVTFAGTDVDGNVASSTYLAETFAPTDTVPSDLLDITGTNANLDLSTVNDTLHLLSTTPGGFVIAAWDGTRTGVFDLVMMNNGVVPGTFAPALPDGTVVWTADGGAFVVTYDEVQNQVEVDIVTVVPEPASLGLLGTGLAGLLARRRRKPSKTA